MAPLRFLLSLMVCVAPLSSAAPPSPPVAADAGTLTCTGLPAVNVYADYTYLQGAASAGSILRTTFVYAEYLQGVRDGVSGEVAARTCRDMCFRDNACDGWDYNETSTNTTAASTASSGAPSNASASASASRGRCTLLTFDTTRSAVGSGSTIFQSTVVPAKDVPAWYSGIGAHDFESMAELAKSPPPIYVGPSKGKPLVYGGAVDYRNRGNVSLCKKSCGPGTFQGRVDPTMTCALCPNGTVAPTAGVSRYACESCRIAEACASPSTCATGYSAKGCGCGSCTRGLSSLKASEYRNNTW
jgi:hypothetical protein